MFRLPACLPRCVSGMFTSLHSTLSHTTVLTFRSFTTSFPFPSFPVPATTFDAHYWKKLTCGVIRSFNSHFDFEMCFAPQLRTLFRHRNFQNSGPNMVCFVHCDFEMCFAPQQCALFRHLNFQKCSERAVFIAFSLANVLRATAACTLSTSQLPKVVRTWCALCILTFGNVLRATTACTFSTSQLPKVVRTWCALCILTWKCASRRNFSSLIWPAGSAPAALASLPPEPQIIGKTQCVAILLPFRAPGSFLLRLSLLWSSLFCSSLFSSSLFCSSLLDSSAPPLLFICPYCRKFDF